jgi:iron(III) transport system substrate-binding protein
MLFMKEYMNKLLFFTLIFTLAIPLVFAGGAKDRAPENKIVIYTSIYEDVIETLKKDLKKQFPKYEIEFVYGGTGTLQTKIAAEQASNRIGCDILLVAEPAYSLELKEKGMLHSYISKEASTLAFDYDREGYWYPVRVSNMVLAYNPQRISINSVPNSFRDFAYDNGVSGAVSMSNPLVSGTAMAAIAALKDKYGFDYFEALARQKVMIDSGAVALAKLETGECKVAMILEESVLRKRQVEKSRIEVIYPVDGTIVIPSTIMIINDQWSANRNTPAAEAISEWFLGKKGQNTIVSGWMHSVRKSFSKLPYNSVSTSQIRANSMLVNWENYKQWDEILDRFEESVINNR